MNVPRLRSIEMCIDEVVPHMLNLFIFCSCWLSTERGFIWAFVGPVVVVMAVSDRFLQLVFMQLK